MTAPAKCHGKDCPQRDTCLRYTAPPNDRPLSSFDAFPQHHAVRCDGYWPIKVSAS